MKKDDAQVPATKQDIAVLRSELNQGLASVRQELKSDIHDLDAKLARFTEEIKLHFDVASERVRDDIRVYGEKLQDHEERITRIERHPRLAAA